MFNPQTEYEVSDKSISIRDFHAYRDDYVVRSPYQRKTVWTKKKQHALLDSLFRRYYIPRIVLRQIRLNEERTVLEVVDGQQRINTVQEFMSGTLTLPQSLADVHKLLPGSTYDKLPTDLKKFVDKELVYEADIIKQIDNPKDPEHQKIAAEIFWRLQQGEPLTYMEIAHARLDSLARNFVVKYADDQRFDYKKYQPIDGNPDKHKFFTVIDSSNERMKHLALLTRFLILEEHDGPTDIKDTNVGDFIDDSKQPDGIDNYSFEGRATAKAVLQNLHEFYSVFKDDPMLAEENGCIKELRTEYFIISLYLLLRHLRKYYVFGDAERKNFRDFTYSLHTRWKEHPEEDRDIVLFYERRQQTAGEIEVRHQIIRQIFFDYCKEEGYNMLTKDEKRAFSELERIKIYRRDNGLCQECLKASKPEKEARVSWAEYDADHVVPHSKGGKTLVENAQVLCRYHNQHKGARP